MKQTKILLALAVIATVFSLSSCCSFCSESGCKEKYGLIKPEECPACPECPTCPTSPCGAGATINSITKAEAAGYIARAASGTPTYKKGVNASPCQMYLISLEAQGIMNIIGQKSDGSYMVIAKYYLASGDSAYADVTGTLSGGPLCPPSTRCN